jgi:hypothetical protein
MAALWSQGVILRIKIVLRILQSHVTPTHRDIEIFNNPDGRGKT